VIGVEARDGDGPSRTGLCLAALAAALTLQGCGKSPSVSLDRPVHPVTAHAAVADPPASRVANRAAKTGERLPVPSASPLRSATEDPPPWLAELLHAPDPNVRIEGLDAWSRQPGASLDPATYALVDSDEAVRARAQAVLEQELARR
jgi:hypothetical protein